MVLDAQDDLVGDRLAVGARRRAPRDLIIILTTHGRGSCPTVPTYAGRTGDAVGQLGVSGMRCVMKIRPVVGATKSRTRSSPATGPVAVSLRDVWPVHDDI